MPSVKYGIVNDLIKPVLNHRWDVVIFLINVLKVSLFRLKYRFIYWFAKSWSFALSVRKKYWNNFLALQWTFFTAQRFKIMRLSITNSNPLDSSLRTSRFARKYHSRPVTNALAYSVAIWMTSVKKFCCLRCSFIKLIC